MEQTEIYITLKLILSQIISYCLFVFVLQHINLFGHLMLNQVKKEGNKKVFYAGIFK